MKILLPLKTQSELNMREHWAVRCRRAKLQRSTAAAVLRCQKLPALPVTVTMVRLGLRDLDGDNLQGALKHVRDGVADSFKIDDRDPRIDWQYSQARARDYGVEIRIEPQQGVL